MRKRITAQDQKVASDAQVKWLNLDECAEVEVTSEEVNYPIESALIKEESAGWRVSEPGKQTIRLHFDHPQRLQRVWLNFLETNNERTQEYALRWSADYPKCTPLRFIEAFSGVLLEEATGITTSSGG